jgi:CSLREA domain-containing protein
LVALVVLAGLVGALAAFGVGPAHAVTTFTVNSTNDTNGTCDTSECTLREAIAAANSTANSGGPDAIEFDIPDDPDTAADDVKTISPASALPTITDLVVIDGYSQTGSAPATATTDAVLHIELDGTGAGFTTGLRISAGGSTVRGLAINRFNFGGLAMETNPSNKIQGNFIGTDAIGTVDLGNSNFGIRAESGSANNTIGGGTAADRNVISGNSGPNVEITGSGTDNNVVAGNYVGTDASGTQALGNGAEGVVVRQGAASTRIGTDGDSTDDAGEGNVVSGHGQDGIELAGPDTVIAGNLLGVDRTGTVDLGNGRAGIQVFTDGADTTIGGTATAARNVISGNSDEGITFSGGNRGLVQGNLIGTDVMGAADLGNDDDGLAIASDSGTMVGGTASGAPNVIAFNGQDGVQVFSGTDHAILGNSIFSNGLVGINLGIPAGVTSNDTDDPDTGPNNLQNFPVLTSASVSGGNVSVSGTLNSAAAKTYRLEFFSNEACDGSGFGEGQTYLGTTNATTDGSGNASFGPLSFPVPSGQPVITATATDPDNNTSEFSQCRSATDITNPGITITTPAEGAQYTLNQDVKADYACNDEAGGSGLKSCVGPVANGADIDTSSLGTKSFKVDAEDNAGNKSALTRTYEVVGDTTRPTVISVSPAENATGVPRNTNVSATFSEDMDEASVETSGVVKLVKQGQSNVLATSVTYDAATRKVTLDPSTNLEPGTAYAAAVTTGAKDLAGNAMAADKTWTFTTAGTPPPPIDGKPLPKKLRNDLIVFTSSRVTPDNPTGDGEIFVMSLTTFGASVTQLTFNNQGDYQPAWSPDGTKIAFTSYRDAPTFYSELYTMNADGTNQTRLTNNSEYDFSPTWSPSGQQIAWSHGGNIWKMNADGSNQTGLTSVGGAQPDWSPNGKKIAFTRNPDHGEADIYTMNADGTNQTNLTPGDSASGGHRGQGHPAWSLNGEKIAFERRVGESGNLDSMEIFTMKANGRNQIRLTNNSAEDSSPTWSPGSTFIAFTSRRNGNNYEIWTMKANGANPANRTNNGGSDTDPDWLKQ